MTQRIEYTVIAHEAEEGGYWTEVPGLPGASSGEALLGIAVLALVVFTIGNRMSRG